jgi:hypothetical protein
MRRASKVSRGMMVKSWWMAVAFVLAGLTASQPVALGAEARPWLCRTKPVFSSNRQMVYQATNRGSSRWLMTFMRFDPSGLGHDGFTVSSTREIGTRTEGRLDPGQWYAVALYLSAGHWICPGNAAESAEAGSSTISSLCYGRDLGECTVKLTVLPQSTENNP